MTKAIDVHIHPPPPSRDIEEFYQTYKDMDIKGILFGVDAETFSGQPFYGNDYVAGIVKKHPDQFIGYTTVDPWKGKLAIKELERGVKELGLRGLKLQPAMQAFFPNDVRFYPLWDKCQELGIPLMIHTGQTRAGIGQPGGGGIKIKYCQPIPYIDDIAADFPGLTIVMLHPAFPWQDEQLSVLVSKSNAFMDLSGWSPLYFSPNLIQYASTLVRNKVMFGTDYPIITPQRWLRDFATIAIPDEVRPLILLENAKRILKLEGWA